MASDEQTADTAVDVDGLRPVGPDPRELHRGADGFVVVAGPGTDVFTDPAGGTPVDAAPGLGLTLDTPPVMVSVRVEPELAATFDAGALLLRSDTGAWAKLALERSPAGRPVIVSVVTRDASDDANGPEVDQPSVELRVHWDGTVVAFHHRTDGRTWDLVRVFALPGGDGPWTLEMLAQSPTGDGCRVTFSEPRTSRRALTDLRDGS